MSHYIGTDIIEIARIKKAIADFGERFLHRIYTDAELELCRNNLPALAARFAAKEAVFKALPLQSNIGWKDIEILSEKSGKPYINLHRNARKHVESMGLDSLDISLSHCREYAIAFVIGESKKPFDPE